MFTANQLRNRYIAALSVIALLTIFSQVVVQFLISDQEYDSRIINIAGRQRMLSQKITKTSFYVARAETKELSKTYRQKLDEMLALWERSHRGLQHGDSELGLPGRNSNEVLALFARIEPDHHAMVAAAQDLLAASARGASIDQAIEQLREHEAAFLKGMDEIVFLYDKDAKHKVAVARWLELGLMTLTLAVLGLEAMFIFAPVTRRIRRDVQALENKNEDMGRLFSANPSAMLLVDNNDLTILDANQKASDLIGISREVVAKGNLRDYLAPEHETNRLFLERIMANESLNDYEVVVVIGARNTVINGLVSVREINFGGRPVYVLGIANISELRKAQQTLERHATFDDMTGLVNRRTGLLLLGKAMARFPRDQRALTICFADLDGLKTTNDRFGHAEGDWLLRATASAFTASIRASDIAIRLGGDEFLLIFHDCTTEAAGRFLSRIDDRLAAVSVEENKPFPIGISYGLITYDPVRHPTPDDLIAEADGLMYRAKQERKKHPTSAIHPCGDNKRGGQSGVEQRL